MALKQCEIEKMRRDGVIDAIEEYVLHMVYHARKVKDENGVDATEYLRKRSWHIVDEFSSQVEARKKAREQALTGIIKWDNAAIERSDRLFIQRAAETARECIAMEN